MPPVTNADTAGPITIKLDDKEDSSYYSFFQLLGGVLRLAEGQLDNLLAKLCPEGLTEISIQFKLLSETLGEGSQSI